MEGAQCYCLRWNNYHSSVVSVMRALLRDGAFLDVTLACDGRSLRAHRLMLASCSDFFSEVLRDNQTEHPIIFLRDVNFWELEAILDFIYNGQVNIMQEQLPGFIRTAEALQIKGLAAVNNNNNPFLNNNNHTFSNNNNVIANVGDCLSSKYHQHLQDLSNKYHLHSNNKGDCELRYAESSTAPTTSPPLQPTPPASDSPPPTPYNKRRRHYSPQPSTTINSNNNSSSCSVKSESDVELPRPPSSYSPPFPRHDSSSSPLNASPSPLTTISDTIHSLALTSPSAASSSVVSMASNLTVAKAISLSKLVHEISSKASIASLKAASLPPHLGGGAGGGGGLPPSAAAAAAVEEFNGRDEEEDLPPPHQPHLGTTAASVVHNTKDWAASKNEDGFPACSLCGKVFKHQGSLVAHYQVHQQRTKCPVCQKVLSRHYHMKVHLLTVHKVPDSEIDSLLRTQCV